MILTLVRLRLKDFSADCRPWCRSQYSRRCRRSGTKSPAARPHRRPEPFSVQPPFWFEQLQSFRLSLQQTSWSGWYSDVSVEPPIITNLAGRGMREAAVRREGSPVACSRWSCWESRHSKLVEWESRYWEFQHGCGVGLFGITAKVLEGDIPAY